MRRRLAALAAAALGLGTIPAAAMPAPVVASGSLEVLGQLPLAGAISTDFLVEEPVAVVSTLNGIATFDISVPTLPVPLGFLPLPHFQNEAVSIAEREDGTRFALIGTDLYNVTPTDSTKAKLTGEEVLVVDLADLASPELVGRVATASSTHTVSCLDRECRYAYTSGAYEPYFNIVDLTDITNPRQVGQVTSIAEEGHDWDTDGSGLAWQVGTKGAVAYDVTDPLNPVPVASTSREGRDDDDTAWNNFILHNSIRPNAAAFTTRQAEQGPLDELEPSVDNGNVLLMTEEDYVDATCEAEGSFATWHIPYTDADRYAEEVLPPGAAPRTAWGKGAITPLDRWNTELLDSGIATPVGAFCSAHYFDFHQDGYVAQGWYQQGLRVLDVRDAADIKQVGYFFTAATETWGAYWVPEYEPDTRATGRKTDIIYTNDPTKGIEILRFTPPATAPEDTVPLRAPILPTWLNPGAASLAALEARRSPKFGYACMLPPAL